VMNVDSCTNPQHFRWTSDRPDIGSSRRSVRPGPIIRPVRLTVGDVTGKLSIESNIRGAID
jgi:hypothetical protein